MSTSFDHSNSRFGVILVAGYPNAGKSTLVNALVGQWSTAVTHKRHTTTRPTIAVFSHKETQIALTDMPGFPLWNGKCFMNADACLLVVDACRGGFLAKSFIHRCQLPLVIVLNKVDKLKKKDILLKQAQEISSTCSPHAVFMCSAKKKDGCSSLAQGLAKMMPHGPWMYDKTTPRTKFDIAHDIIKEQMLCHTHQEIPYVAQIEGYIKEHASSIEIFQTIILPRKEQRQHAIGTKGQTIKRLHYHAERKMNKVFGCSVSLTLRVEKKFLGDGSALA